MFLNKLTQYKLLGSVSSDQLLTDYLNFTVKFSTYSKTQNPDFGLIYLFDTRNNLFVGNYLDQDIIIYIRDNLNLAVDVKGCKSKIKAGASFDGIGAVGNVDLADIGLCNETLNPGSGNYNVSFVIGDIKYSSDIIAGIPEVVIVSQEFKNDQRKVFLNEFVDGYKIDINGFCSNLPVSASDNEVCQCNLRNDEEKCEKLNSKGCRWNNGVCS